jgi:hypothetical protein
MSAPRIVLPGDIAASLLDESTTSIKLKIGPSLAQAISEDEKLQVREIYDGRVPARSMHTAQGYQVRRVPPQTAAYILD